MNPIGGTTLGADDIVADVNHIGELLARLHEWQLRCTCDRTSVLDCPNYQRGDEEWPTPWR